jgi:uncharacterized RDD family membrane protein YckC
MDHREPSVHQRLLRRVLSQPMTSVADAVVPVVVDAVDLNDAVRRIEVNELIDRIDVDTLTSKIDVEALVERVDVDELVRRVDADAVVRRVDVEALLARVDLDALLARVDVAALLARVDLDALVQRVDVDALLQRVDVDQVVARLQIGALVNRTTGGLLLSFLDLLRRQLVGLDVVVMRILGRSRRHRAGAIPSGPELLRRNGLATGEVSGRYAGPASRLAAFGIDIGVVLALFGLASGLVAFVVQLVSGYRLVNDSGVWWTVAYLVWWFFYLWASLAVAGRTFGKLVVGLRVVDADGHPLSVRRALLRTIAFPLSFLLFFLGFVLALFQKQRRALHDLLAGTCEVYDWGDRPAQLPSPLTSWLTHHGALQGNVPVPSGPMDGRGPRAG